MCIATAIINPENSGTRQKAEYKHRKSIIQVIIQPKM